MRTVKSARRAARLVGFGLLLLASGAIAWASQGVTPTPASSPGPSSSSAASSALPQGFAGQDACKECHVAATAGYARSAHARAWDPRTPAAANACETCHGAAETHTKDPTVSLKKFTKMAPRDVSAACMTCHNREEHTNWRGSMHDSRNVTCVNCHSIHAPTSESGQLRKVGVVETCGQCHRDKLAKLQRSAHMPVREGKMTCATCHNQHGSTNTRMLRAGNIVNEFCVSCHAEKRGPFVWEHAPVRENCTTCHDPHGSSNDRLLVAKAPMLCQRCHISTRHPPTPYDAVQLASKNNRLIGRSCVNCHSQIHGSNHPSGMRFQR